MTLSEKDQANNTIVIFPSKGIFSLAIQKLQETWKVLKNNLQPN